MVRTNAVLSFRLPSYRSPNVIRRYKNKKFSLSLGAIGHRLAKAKWLCSVSEVVSGHHKDLRKVPKLQKGIHLSQSMRLLEVTNQFLPVGSGKF